MAKVVKVRLGRGKSGGWYIQVSATEITAAKSLGWSLIQHDGKHLHGPLSLYGVKRCLEALDRDQCRFRVVRSNISCDAKRRWTVTGPATDVAEAVLESACIQYGIRGDGLFALLYREAKAIAALATELIHDSHRATQVCGYPVSVLV